MALTLHYHPLSSYSWKVLIALYELEIPFEPRIVNLGDAQARADFEALWPMAKIPLLQDGGHIVPETSVQIDYLNQRANAATLLPLDPAGQMQVRLWDRLFDCYVMDPMQRFIAQRLRAESERDARACEEARALQSRAYGMVESRGCTVAWAAGEQFSLADCAAAPALFYAATVQPFAPEHVRLEAYFERLMARPSVRRVIAQAQPFFQYYPLRDRLPARWLAAQP